MAEHKRVTGASLSATNGSDASQTCIVSSQLLDHKPQQNVFKSGPHPWNKEAISDTGAMPLTPLASVSWDNGQEVRLFYLSSAHIIHEFRLVKGSTEWKLGTLHKLGINAIPGAGLAATVYHVPNSIQKEIYLYYQNTAGAIKELICERSDKDSWKAGTTVTTEALFGTSLAVVSYPDKDKIKIHLFYQGKGLFLQEIVHTGGWSTGDFYPGTATAKTPLAAISFENYNGDREVQLYWRDSRGVVVFARNVNEIWGDPRDTNNKVEAGYQLAVIQWNNGYDLRFYFQDFRSPEVFEWASKDGGSTWYKNGSL